MTEFTFYKLTRFRFDSYDIINETKYECQPDTEFGLKNLVRGDGKAISVSVHPYTHTNPLSLFKQIACLYNKNDVIKTVPDVTISAMDFMSEEHKHNPNLIELILIEPLSSDELKILAKEVLYALKNKK